MKIIDKNISLMLIKINLKIDLRLFLYRKSTIIGMQGDDLKFQVLRNWILNIKLSTIIRFYSISVREMVRMVRITSMVLRNLYLLYANLKPQHSFLNALALL